MVKKGKKDDKEDLGAMRAARFGRVKNTLSMGFGESLSCYEYQRIAIFRLLNVLY